MGQESSQESKLSSSEHENFIKLRLQDQNKSKKSKNN